jgi:hypothetical protein
MTKFPIDAPKQKVIKSLEILGFRVIREKEHISMERANPVRCRHEAFERAFRPL